MLIDINAIEMVDGEPETIIDYIDKVLAPEHMRFLGKANRDDVGAVRSGLIRRGALRARALRCQPGQLNYCDAEPEYERQANCTAEIHKHKERPVPEEFIQNYLQLQHAHYEKYPSTEMPTDEVMKQDAAEFWPHHINGIAYEKCVSQH